MRQQLQDVLKELREAFASPWGLVWLVVCPSIVGLVTLLLLGLRLPAPDVNPLVIGVTGSAGSEWLVEELRRIHGTTVISISSKGLPFEGSGFDAVIALPDHPSDQPVLYSKDHGARERLWQHCGVALHGYLNTLRVQRLRDLVTPMDERTARTLLDTQFEELRMDGRRMGGSLQTDLTTPALAWLAFLTGLIVCRQHFVRKYTFPRSGDPDLGVSTVTGCIVASAAAWVTALLFLWARGHVLGRLEGATIAESLGPRELASIVFLAPSMFVAAAGMAVAVSMARSTSEARGSTAFLALSFLLLGQFAVLNPRFAFVEWTATIPFVGFALVWRLSGWLLVLHALACIGIGTSVLVMADRWKSVASASRHGWLGLFAVGGGALISGLGLGSLAVSGGLTALAGAVQTIALGSALTLFGRRLWSARRQSGRVEEQHVLYLRPFVDDYRQLRGTLYNFLGFRTTEEHILAALRTLGEVRALGRPGERLPWPGAYRQYQSEAGWRVAISEELQGDPFVALRIGSSDALSWELQEVRRLASPRRVVAFVVARDPFDEPLHSEWWRLARPRIEADLGARWPDSIPTFAVVSFDEEWRPTFCILYANLWDLVNPRSPSAVNLYRTLADVFPEARASGRGLQVPVIIGVMMAVLGVALAVLSPWFPSGL